MTRNCSIFETVILYTFSLWYLINEWLGRLFWMKSGLSGQVFLRCEGRTALVTGGTSGIGFETVKKLLSFGMNVIIASNVSAQESEKCVQQLRILYPKSKVEVWYVDLSSLESVKALAEKYLLSGLPLHVLINNAGIMFSPYQKSADGLEMHMAVNYFSHCLLTKLLLPRLKQSGNSKCKARVVNVASCLHYLSEIDFHDLNSVQRYCRYHSYMQSKLCLVMFTLSLNQFLRSSGCEVIAHCVHPGVIYSNLYKHVWWASILGPLFFQKPDKGAEVTVYAALSANLENEGGRYIEECRPVKPSRYARDYQLQTRLWNETFKTLLPWLDEPDDLQPEC
ncbi:dehydrogenase/reductase SDR family member on chromosome X-like [Uloborus diversus]|uniref:dehydrogenase/reductase SDR family member on chromosome X-like n=1 Tax=Uloborus diversus TaxID=327109 RepID=UPI00240958BB|nr:dehydrogenase/reductase SDR family member on chromosome X-like [Uloborus diversus]